MACWLSRCAEKSNQVHPQRAMFWHHSLLDRLWQFHGFSAISSLRRSVAIAEHYDQRSAALNVVHTPARPKRFLAQFALRASSRVLKLFRLKA